MLALVTEILGDRRRQHRPMHAAQRRLVRGYRDHDRPCQALFAEDVVDELLDLTTALADQTDHHHVCIGVARHHAKQHGLADAGAGEQAEALSATDAEQRIDRADTDIQRLADRCACQRVDIATVQWPTPGGMQRPLAVERFAAAIDDTAQQFVTDDRLADAPGRHHAGIRLETTDVTGRHEVQAFAGESDHLGLDTLAGSIDHVTAAADGSAATDRLQGQAHHACQLAFHHHAAGPADALTEAVNALGPDRVAIQFSGHFARPRRCRACVRRPAAARSGC